MTEIISVRFKAGGKEYFFNPNGVRYQPGQSVIIETSRGVEFGECTKGNTMVDEMTLVSPLRPVLRLATPEDCIRVEQNRVKESDAFAICEKKILEHNLDMKLVEVEYSFDASKILFFFTSDGRVDFRDLVRDLAAVFHTRIELRQIGVRDEAKLLGGLGICGRPFCCTTFLEDFQPVSIKMAKTQSLSLNPTKISGTCGRLMCCLKYEQDAYEDAIRRCPKVESLVETPDGIGTIRSVNLLRETAKVRLDSAPDQAETYPCEELRVIRSGKGKRPEGYELPEPQPKPERTRLQESAPAPTEVAAPPVVKSAQRKPASKPAVPAPVQNEEAPAPTKRKKPDKKKSAPKPAEAEKAAAPKVAEGEGTPAPTKRKKPDKKKSAPKPAEAEKAAAPKVAEGEGTPAPTKRKKPAPPAPPAGEEKKDDSAAPKKSQGNRRNHHYRNHHRKKPASSEQ